MAQRKRTRRPTRAVPTSNEPTGDKRDRVTVAWTGVTFLLVAAAGLEWAPGLRLLWIVLLIFGAATIPQVMAWWIAERKRRL